MQKQIKGITFYSYVWEIIIFGGFISANEFAIKNLVQAYVWFFYFMTTIAVFIFFCGFKEPRYQYTQAKYHWEMVTNTLLGIMLAYYGYFVCASILTFFGYVSASHHYFIKDKENGKTE